MRYSTAIVAFVGFSAAQTLTDLPPCSQQCLLKAITDSSQCQVGNTACLCNPTNFQAIVTAATPCVLQSCGPDAAVNQVIPAATRICEAAGGSVASSVVRSASSAISAAVSSAVVVTSTRASTTASAAVSSAVGAISGPVTSTPRVPITRTSIVTSTITTTYNGTSVATTTQIPVTVNGAAAHGPIGIAAAIAIGAFAYL
ncbi:hypothetical protein LX32DRAFT_726462 [Colletotrichum zoysiae]|uniref:CFEM domain-containing protein n=1 Tax=Colletotrichum zoysiae TaxID=1216348 RepID=A0AAD9HNF0_9PEZI|nr:hypothetical protein LX32DRAFT_726462 [Colletotrichum zoysiae]